MDMVQPLQALIPDRPLLGVWVLVTCLAGGAATQNLAVVPHSVDRIDYKFDRTASLPAVALSAERAPAALVAPPKFRQFRAFGQIAPDAVAADLAPHMQMAEIADSSAAPALPRAVQPAPLIAPEPKAALPLSDVQLAVAPQPVAVADLAAAQPTATFDASFAGLAALPLEVRNAEPAVVPEPAAPALANPVELRGFDLARVAPSAARRSAALVAPRSAVKPGTAKPSTTAPKPRAASARDRMIDATVFHPTTIMIGGESAGRLDVRIGPDMKPSIKVGDLLGMVSAQMDPELAAHLSAASGAAEYVSFSMLRDAGFKVSYNAGADSVSIAVAD